MALHVLEKCGLGKLGRESWICIAAVTWLDGFIIPFELVTLPYQLVVYMYSSVTAAPVLAISAHFCG